MCSTFTTVLIFFAGTLHTLLGLNVNNGIILIPGIAGTSLYVTLKNATLPACSNTETFTSPRIRLWASIMQALPPKSHQECWLSKLELSWTCASKDGCKFLSREGIQIDTSSLGDTKGVEYLDTVQGVGVPATKYFHDILETFRKLGYVDGDTLLAYGFDWRYPIWELDLKQLKTIVETFKTRYPSRKVVLVAHSLGALVANTFLNQYVDINWKQQHIEKFISIAGAYGGSQKVVHALLSGNIEDTIYSFFGTVSITIVPNIILRDTQRTFGSMYNLMPNPKVFGGETPVVRTLNETNSDKNVDYTLMNWWELLPKKLQILAQQMQARMLFESSGSLADPQVPVYCLWSVFDEPSTQFSFQYESNDMSLVPTVNYSKGDHTLLMESASYCTNWNSTVFSLELKNLDHMRILFDRDFTKLVASFAADVPVSTIITVKRDFLFNMQKTNI